MGAVVQCCEDHGRVQVVGCGDGHYVQVWKVAQDIFPGCFAPVGCGRVSGPLFKVGFCALCGCFAARGYCDQIKFDVCKVARPGVESDSPHQATDAVALQVRKRPGVDIATKHPGANQCNCYFFRHSILHSRLGFTT